MAPPIIPEHIRDGRVGNKWLHERQATPSSEIEAINPTSGPPSGATQSISIPTGPQGATQSISIPRGGNTAATQSISIPTPTTIATQTLSLSTGLAVATQSISIPGASSRSGSATVLSETQTPSAPSPTSTSTTSSSGFPGGQTSIVIAVVVVIGAALFFFIGYIVAKGIRSRHKDPKYLPGSFLKNKWMNWEVGYNTTSTDPVQREINRQARTRANILANRALDRSNSVRSVITLPPYREMSDIELERTIGREGERDGLDVITVFPENAEEEEARREERMQAMYELRLQRRAQRAAREARENFRSSSTPSVNIPTLGNDAASLHGIDMETGGSGRSTSELTAAVLNERQRRLSEVSYSDVGFARHDGSRIRSSSSTSQNRTGSDSQPLLADNASTTRRSRSGSMLSLNTNVSGDRNSMDRRDSAEIISNGQADLGEVVRHPPSYDGLEWGEAPPYMSPVSPVTRSNTAASQSTQRRGRQSGLDVPVLRVTDASNPNSPMSPQNRRGAGGA